ncbi:hypothetical protein Ctha_2472 [Chloroherpeton thalassium ATCC 35110]|uniref:Uncharacterized protein n=2 Tax=Chloroherpeton thalassium TaxID=100716 RepID=B3QXK6_CHLT3|nr:hypothetical protein Ctha_2472 [Chloroherpeton thalassium ATCC 35110]
MIALSLVGCDVLCESVGVYKNVFELRMLTGFLLGVTIAPFLNRAIQDFFQIANKKEKSTHVN